MVNSQWSIGHHRAHCLHVLYEIIHLQVRIVHIIGAFGVSEQIEYPVDRFYRVARIGWKFDIPWIGHIRGSVHRMICGEKMKFALVNISCFFWVRVGVVI